MHQTIINKVHKVAYGIQISGYQCLNTLEPIKLKLLFRLKRGMKLHSKQLEQRKRAGREKKKHGLISTELRNAAVKVAETTVDCNLSYLLLKTTYSLLTSCTLIQNMPNLFFYSEEVFDSYSLSFLTDLIIGVHRFRKHLLLSAVARNLLETSTSTNFCCSGRKYFSHNFVECCRGPG